MSKITDTSVAPGSIVHLRYQKTGLLGRLFMRMESDSKIRAAAPNDALSAADPGPGSD
jgi:hypothetical protein